MAIASASGEGTSLAAVAALGTTLVDSKKAEADQLISLTREKNEQVLKKLAKQMLTIESQSFEQRRRLELDTDVVESKCAFLKLSPKLIQILIQPLEKRFKFHFFTNRKTNNLDKVSFGIYLTNYLYLFGLLFKSNKRNL